MKDVFYLLLLLFGWVTVEPKTVISDELNTFKYIATERGCYVNHYTVRHEDDPREHPTNVIPRDSYPVECYPGVSHIGMNFANHDDNKAYLLICGFMPANKQIKCQKLLADGKTEPMFDYKCDGYEVKTKYQFFYINDFMINGKSLDFGDGDDVCLIFRKGNGFRFEHTHWPNPNMGYDPLGHKDVLTVGKDASTFALGPISFDYFADNTCQVFTQKCGTEVRTFIKSIHLSEGYNYIYEMPDYKEDRAKLVIPSIDRPVNKEAVSDEFVSLKYAREEEDGIMRCNLVIKGLLENTVTIPVKEYCDDYAYLYHGIGYDFNQKNNRWSIWLCLVDEDLKMNCTSYRAQPGKITGGRWKKEFGDTVKECAGSKSESKVIISSVKAADRRQLEITLVTDKSSCVYKVGRKKMALLRSSSGNTWMYDNGYDPVRDQPISLRGFKLRNGEVKHMFFDSYGKHHFQHTRSDVIVHYLNGKETKTFADVDAVLEYPTAVRILLNHHSFNV